MGHNFIDFVGAELGAGRRVSSGAIFRRRTIMISWAVTFLIVALVAAVLGFSGIAGVATNIAWILFVVGLTLAVIFAITGRRPSV